LHPHGRANSSSAGARLVSLARADAEKRNALGVKTSVLPQRKKRGAINAELGTPGGGALVAMKNAGRPAFTGATGV
jgi:hypothetical protein